MTTLREREGGAPERKGAPRPSGTASPSREIRKQAAATPWLFLAPYLVLLIAFVLVPIVFGAWISLHTWDYTRPLKPFVGLENYAELFRSGSGQFTNFWGSMRATGIFTLFSVPLLLTIPLAVALLMAKKFPGRNFFRAIYFAPYVLGVAVVAVMWRYLLDNNIGLVNYYLGLVGLPNDIAWTTSTPAAWVALVGVTVWWTLGFNTVIYLAGLQGIPRDHYEAASLDGATGCLAAPVPAPGAGALSRGRRGCRGCASGWSTAGPGPSRRPGRWCRWTARSRRSAPRR